MAQQLTKHVYAETGFRGCNPGFVVTTAGVVMIDAPQRLSDALAWREEIARHGRVRYLINTEPHGDHWTSDYLLLLVVHHEPIPYHGWDTSPPVSPSPAGEGGGREAGGTPPRPPARGAWPLWAPLMATH